MAVSIVREIVGLERHAVSIHLQFELTMQHYTARHSTYLEVVASIPTKPVTLRPRSKLKYGQHKLVPFDISYKVIGVQSRPVPAMHVLPQFPYFPNFLFLSLFVLFDSVEESTSGGA
jgi:hypothetical protein